MTLSVADERVRVLLEAENKGNESAERVKAVLHIFGGAVEAQPIDRIDAGNKTSFAFELPLPKEKTGRFPFVGEVFFHDHRMNPYSALTAGTFPAAGGSKPGISARASYIAVATRGTLKIIVTNRLGSVQPLKATLFLPYALTASRLEQEIQAEPGKQSAVEFELSNRCGIGGARYPIFCVLEYDENGAPNTVLVQSLVTIKEPENWFVRTRWYWLWGFFGILGVWGMMGLYGRRSGA